MTLRVKERVKERVKALQTGKDLLALAHKLKKARQKMLCAQKALEFFEQYKANCAAHADVNKLMREAQAIVEQAQKDMDVGTQLAKQYVKLLSKAETETDAETAQKELDKPMLVQLLELLVTG